MSFINGSKEGKNTIDYFNRSRKAFDIIQKPFLMKMLNELEIEFSYFTKHILQNHTSTIEFNILYNSN